MFHLFIYFFLNMINVMKNIYLNLKDNSLHIFRKIKKKNNDKRREKTRIGFHKIQFLSL